MSVFHTQQQKRGILQAIINHMNCNKICSLQACKMRAKKALQPIVEPLVAVHTFVILLIMCSWKFMLDLKTNPRFFSPLPSFMKFKRFDIETCRRNINESKSVFSSLSARSWWRKPKTTDHLFDLFLCGYIFGIRNAAGEQSNSLWWHFFELPTPTDLYFLC